MILWILLGSKPGVLLTFGEYQFACYQKARCSLDREGPHGYRLWLWRTTGMCTHNSWFKLERDLRRYAQPKWSQLEGSGKSLGAVLLHSSEVSESRCAQVTWELLFRQHYNCEITLTPLRRSLLLFSYDNIGTTKQVIFFRIDDFKYVWKIYLRV